MSHRKTPNVAMRGFHYKDQSDDAEGRKGRKNYCIAFEIRYWKQEGDGSTVGSRTFRAKVEDGYAEFTKKLCGEACVNVVEVAFMPYYDKGKQKGVAIGREPGRIQRAPHHYLCELHGRSVGESPFTRNVIARCNQHMFEGRSSKESLLDQPEISFTGLDYEDKVGDVDKVKATVEGSLGEMSATEQVKLDDDKKRKALVKIITDDVVVIRFETMDWQGKIIGNVAWRPSTPGFYIERAYGETTGPSNFIYNEVTGTDQRSEHDL